MAASPAASLSPGQRVRVTREGASERALLLCVHDESAQAEVELLDGTEALVQLASLRQLRSFELAPAGAAGQYAVAFAERCKTHGNALFKLRDLSAALEFYLQGSRALRDDAPVAEGSRCVVLPASNGRAQGLRCAMVLTRDVERCEVLYESLTPPAARPGRVTDAAEPSSADSRVGGGWLSWLTGSRDSGVAPAAEVKSASVAEQVAAILRRLDAADRCTGDGIADAGVAEASEAGLGRRGSECGEQSDEEEELPVSRLLPVHPAAAALQCALYLNSARCSLLSGAWAAALARAARVDRIAALVAGEKKTQEAEQCAVYRRTALVLSARAALGARRFGLAVGFASALLDAPTAGAADVRREVRGLVTEIERKRVALARSNKRLAREVSAWVEEAMQAGEVSGAARGLHTAADEE